MPTPNPPSLAESGRVLLISCYELGHAPLGVAWPAGFLAEAGYRPRVLDLSVEQLNHDWVREASFIAISVPMHTALRMALVATGRIREVNPEAHVCFYGHYAALNADHLLQAAADSVLGGEIEPSLVDWIDALASGNPDADIAGLSIPTVRRPPRLTRSRFALPDRTGLAPLSAYARLEGSMENRVTGYTEASRGCKHHCLHCPLPPVYGGRFFVVPVERVMEDVAQLVAQGASHITFGDPDFFNGPTHAMRLARALHAAFPQVTYDVTVKVEHLLRHGNLLPELARTGCVFIVSAVESMSQEVLENLDKGHHPADIGEALHRVRDAGMALRPTWVAFTPWTTLGDLLNMLEFVGSEGLVHQVDPVQYTIRLLVPPGSGLLQSPAFTPFAQPLDAERLFHPWVHPDSRMDRLQEQITALVESAVQRETPADEIFQAVYASAMDAAGRHGAPLLLGPQPEAPRLTEPWFC